jgi:hypothetical protein
VPDAPAPGPLCTSSGGTEAKSDLQG